MAMRLLRLLLASLFVLLASCTQNPAVPPKPGPLATQPAASRPPERPGPSAPSPKPPVVAPPAAAPPAAPPAPRGLAARCSGTPQLCEAWVQFRRSVPWPYQGLGLRQVAPGEWVVLIAEPPPTATREELDSLLSALFGGALLERARLRFPTGLDGWLEDTLLRVSVDPRAPTTQVMSGHDLRAWSVPRPLAERLQFLHQSLQLTREGFCVDNLQALWAQGGRAKVPTVAVSARDVHSWLAPKRDWSRLGAATDKRQWAQLLQASTPQVFHLPGEGLVALTLPPDAPAARLAEPLRLFGIAADLTVAAVRSSTGTLVLLGRTRRLPLTLLPPLRLETLAMLRQSRGRELGQSYERGRIFAGKIDSGPAMGWDWAPIYLSENLEDTELGTLLNLADQVLKSWSQHGDVDYYSFDYAKPQAFPFGALAASDYFTQQLRTTSLTFNWNTTGFTAWVDMPSGGIVTPDRGSVLPITYLPGNDITDQRGDTRTVALARDAADRAREVFAAQGDPLLARVAQHVLVFHALSTLGSPAAAADGDGRRHRTDTVNDALRQQAERWLSTPGLASQLEPTVSADINTLRRRMGLSTRQIAELLANPRSRRLSQKEEELQRGFAAYRTLQQSLAEMARQSDAAFDRMCHDLKGTKTRLGNGERCNYQWPVGRPLPPSAQAYEQGEQSFKDLVAQRSRQADALRAQEDALDKEYERQQTAQRIARKVAGRAGDTWEEATVLRAVLDSAARVPANGSIRTPSVVLSRDSRDVYSVGGHNIGAGPTRVVIGEPGTRPSFRRVGNELSLVMSPEQLRSSADLVRRGVDGTPQAADRPLQTTRAALELEGLGSEPPLRATLQHNAPPRMSDADVVKHFANQECGTCVLRDSDNHLYVLDKGPPTAVRTAGDMTELPQLIHGARRREVVMYEGMETVGAALITDSVRVMDAQAARASPIQRAIEGARAFFGKGPAAGAEHTVVTFKDTTGTTHQFTLIGARAAPAKFLKIRWGLRDAQVFDPGPDAIAWLKLAGQKSREGAEPVVTVARFSQRGGAQIDLGVIGSYPTGRGSAQVSAVKDALSNAGRAEADLWAVMASIRSELSSRLRPQELEFFVRVNAGDIRVVRMDQGARWQ